MIWLPGPKINLLGWQLQEKENLSIYVLKILSLVPGTSF